MENFNEAAFEQAFIELLKNAGWTYTDGESIHRRPQDILLEDDLRTYLTRRFSAEHLTEREIKSIITAIRLENAPSFYNANRNIFHLICNGEYWQRDDSSLPNLRVPYIDFEHTENNTYRCVNQYTVKQNAERRPDILLFINGIPMTIIELKSAVKEDTTIANAWQQIHNRYIRDIPASCVIAACRLFPMAPMHVWERFLLPMIITMRGKKWKTKMNHRWAFRKTSH